MFFSYSTPLRLFAGAEAENNVRRGRRHSQEVRSSHCRVRLRRIGMAFFSSDKSASKYWPRIVYSIAVVRLFAWSILITFCVVCFESSAVELNKIIRESRPHFSGLTVEQTRDFLIIYLVFGILYVLIDGEFIFRIFYFNGKIIYDEKSPRKCISCKAPNYNFVTSKRRKRSYWKFLQCSKSKESFKN